MRSVNVDWWCAIGGLFKEQARGEKVLAELQAAGFATAQISEIEDESTSTPAPTKLGNTIADVFKDHQSTRSDFRDNLTELGMSEQDAHYFEDGVARGGALVTVKADARASEAMAIYSATARLWVRLVVREIRYRQLAPHWVPGPQ